jgi:hypothetical protein
MPKRKPKQQSAYSMATRSRAIQGGAQRIEVMFPPDDMQRLEALKAAGFADSSAECIRRAVREAATSVDK